MGINHSTVLGFSGLFLFFISCGIYTSVSISEDKTADFAGYKTFAWLHDEADTANSPYNNQVIRNNIRNYYLQNLVSRGYTFEPESPDMLLQVVVVNKKKIREVYFPVYPESHYYCSYYYCSFYYSPVGFTYYYNYPYTPGYIKKSIEYVEGAITLNVIDRKQGKLVWSGTASGDIYDPEYLDKDIHPAVLRIMKKFPVRNRRDKVNPQKSIVTNEKIN